MSLVGFPLLLIPFAIYNIIAFLMPGVNFSAPVTHVSMMSGAEWTMTPGDFLICLGVVMLFCELLKATRIGMRTVVDHGLSFLVFLAMGAEFVLVREAGTATFFILLVIGFVDVLGGFAVSLRSAQRDLTIENGEHIVR
jgi:hypothetical protein